MSAKMTESTIGDTAVKTQTANVGHLQQRVFAKYDLPSREVADSLLDYFHEKGKSTCPSASLYLVDMTETGFSFKCTICSRSSTGRR